jgi:hypothetical protein
MTLYQVDVDAEPQRGAPESGARVPYAPEPGTRAPYARGGGAREPHAETRGIGGPRHRAARGAGRREDAAPALAGRLWRGAWTVTFALGLGAVAGALSWYGHDRMYGGARLLGDSAAAWLAIAFVAGRQTRSVVGGALAGFLALGVAVLAYYAAQEAYAMWVESDRAIGYWQLLAAVTGPVFGSMGAASRAAMRATPSVASGMASTFSAPVLRGLAVAGMGAACCAEAIVGFRNAATDATQNFYLVEACIGVLGLLIVSRDRRALPVALVALPVFALVSVPLLDALVHAQHDVSLPLVG